MPKGREHLLSNGQDGGDEVLVLINRHPHTSNNNLDQHSSSKTSIAFGNPNHRPGFITYDVQPGDTLQNISVRFSCPVASIKRFNNLLSDQEFFGLSKLRLPAGKVQLSRDALLPTKTDGLLVDVSDTNRIENFTSAQSSHTTGLGSTIPSVNKQTLETFCDNHQAAVQTHDARQYRNHSANHIDYDYCNNVDENNDNSKLATSNMLGDLDKRISAMKLAATSYEDKSSEIFQSLAQSGSPPTMDDIRNMMARRQAEVLIKDMTDTDLSFSGLILFIFIVCLICPLAYIIYLEETQADSHA